jgi:hypothetical protein
LAHLRFSEIKQCQLVRPAQHLRIRAFGKTKHISGLQEALFSALLRPDSRFRLELAKAGYTEPLNSRTDISAAQATRILRAHLSRQVSRVDVLPSFMSKGFDVARPRGRSLSEPEIRPMFFGEVLARWFSVWIVHATSDERGALAVAKQGHRHRAMEHCGADNGRARLLDGTKV